jgi:hypothetical protein
MKFIIGLNLEKGNKNLTKAQMDAAVANLPPAAIVTFEIGNEVRAESSARHIVQGPRGWPPHLLLTCMCAPPPHTHTHATHPAAQLLHQQGGPQRQRVRGLLLHP